MIYGGHQTSFIPWIGFWHKVAHVDYFDISIYDQFTKKTWQHFSFIASHNKKQKWGLELDKDFEHHSSNFKLNQVNVIPNFSSRLLSEFEEKHRNDKYFSCIFPNLIVWLEKVDRMNSLWLINFILLENIKTFLGIDTPFVHPSKKELFVASQNGSLSQLDKGIGERGGKPKTPKRNNYIKKREAELRRKGLLPKNPNLKEKERE